MYCTECGQQNYSSDLFCSMCGAKFTSKKGDVIQTGRIDGNAQQINVVVNTGKQDSSELACSAFTILLGYISAFCIPAIGFFVGCFVFIKGHKGHGTAIIIISSIISFLLLSTIGAV